MTGMPGYDLIRINKILMAAPEKAGIIKMSIGDVPVSTGEAGPELRAERCRPRKISTKNQVPTIALPTLQCPSLHKRSGYAAIDLFRSRSPASYC